MSHRTAEGEREKETERDEEAERDRLVNHPLLILKAEKISGLGLDMSRDKDSSQAHFPSARGQLKRGSRN